MLSYVLKQEGQISLWSSTGDRRELGWAGAFEFMGALCYDENGEALRKENNEELKNKKNKK